MSAAKARALDSAAAIDRWIGVLALRPRRAALVLLALCLAVYLPGVTRLPPVDRTEVVYAETTREMVAHGQWLDPRYGDVVHAFRPIGTYWAQALSATLAGADHARDITVYRLPGLIAVTLAVLALFWLTAPLIGARPALIAAALFAVAPLTVLVATLAITDGLALLPAVVAMLCLLRLYADDEDANHQAAAPIWLPRLFWSAVGFGMLVNALHTPILVTVTLIALYAMDRDAWWWQRLQISTGLPIALALAAPWLIVRVYQDGVPFSGMGFKAFFEALGGAQDMKLRAFPGTFVAAMLLGFLPGTALIAPALLKLWIGRDAKLARFLLAWVVGYLLYLELISSKPGTYTVQVLYPALAIAVAMLVTAEHGKTPAPAWHFIPWPPLAALFALALFTAPYAILREMPPLWIVPLILVVAALFYISAREGRAGQLQNWALSGVAALALFAVTLLGAVLPGIDAIWPARQIQRFVETSCDPNASVGLVGFREPSASFLLGGRGASLTPEALVKAAPDVQIVESRWLERTASALSAAGRTFGPQYGCNDAANAMRGCRLTFLIIGRPGGDHCFKQPAASCNAQTLARPGGSACD